MSGGSTAPEIILTIFLYILGHRLFLIALNLILGALFALLLYSIPRLRRRGISYRWFRLLVREERAHDRPPPVGHAETQQTYISLRTLSRVSFRSPHSSRPSSPPPRNPFLDPEIAAPNTRRSPDGSSVAPFITEYTNPSLSRSDSGGSLEPTSSSATPWQRPLEPLRRPTAEGQESISTFPSYVTTPSLSTAQATDTESLNIDISDVEIPETSVFQTPGGILNEDPVSGTHGRVRPPTYGTTFSHQSFLTLPIYKETDDDRASVTSQAPTYHSTLTAHSPHSPHSFRSTRPPLPPLPLPRPPLPLPPLPLPPSSGYPPKVT